MRFIYHAIFRNKVPQLCYLCMMLKHFKPFTWINSWFCYIILNKLVLTGFITVWLQFYLKLLNFCSLQPLLLQHTPGSLSTYELSNLCTFTLENYFVHFTQGFCKSLAPLLKGPLLNCCNGKSHSITLYMYSGNAEGNVLKMLNQSPWVSYSTCSVSDPTHCIPKPEYTVIKLKSTH